MAKKTTLGEESETSFGQRQNRNANVWEEMPSYIDSPWTETSRILLDYTQLHSLTYA